MLIYDMYMNRLHFRDVTVKVLVRLCSFLQFRARVLFENHSVCWQNSLPGSYKAEAFSSKTSRAVLCHVALFIGNSQHGCLQGL